MSAMAPPALSGHRCFVFHGVQVYKPTSAPLNFLPSSNKVGGNEGMKAGVCAASQHQT